METAMKVRTIVLSASVATATGTFLIYSLVPPILSAIQFIRLALAGGAL
jgi:hypothetical protein